MQSIKTKIAGTALLTIASVAYSAGCSSRQLDSTDTSTERTGVVQAALTGDLMSLVEIEESNHLITIYEITDPEEHGFAILEASPTGEDPIVPTDVREQGALATYSFLRPGEDFPSALMEAVARGASWPRGDEEQQQILAEEAEFEYVNAHPDGVGVEYVSGGEDFLRQQVEVDWFMTNAWLPTTLTQWNATAWIRTRPAQILSTNAAYSNDGDAGIPMRFTVWRWWKIGGVWDWHVRVDDRVPSGWAHFWTFDHSGGKGRNWYTYAEDWSGTGNLVGLSAHARDRDPNYFGSGNPPQEDCLYTVHITTTECTNYDGSRSEYSDWPTSVSGCGATPELAETRAKFNMAQLRCIHEGGGMGCCDFDMQEFSNYCGCE